MKEGKGEQGRGGEGRRRKGGEGRGREWTEVKERSEGCREMKTGRQGSGKE
jgi:hypothetical protein